MLLSVCIVVSEGARSIAKTIYSASKIADEIIVIDLDSYDNTADIASSMGATVFRIHNEYNLCKSKNFAREKAAGNWILFLEANEELLDDYKQLRLMLSNSSQDGYYLPVSELNYLKENRDHGVQNFSLPRLSLRLYQNRKNYKYSNDSHQSITNSILKEKGGASLKVLHLPIIRKPVESILPVEIRPATLYYLEVDQEIPIGEKAFKYLKEGIKYFWEKDFQQASRSLYEGYIEVDKKYKVFLLKNFLFILLENRQYNRAEKILKDAIEEYPGYSIFRFWQGYIEYIRGDYKKSINSFQTIIENQFRDKEKNIKQNTEFLLGLVYLADNNYPDAGKLLREAMCQFPGNRLIINVLIELSGLNLSKIYDYFRPDEADNRKKFLLVMECLNARKEYRLMEKLIERQTIISDKENILLYWKGIISLKQEYYDRSLSYFKNITPDFKDFKKTLIFQWIVNLNTPVKFESRSIVNQIKLLGDKTNWNLINFFNEIYFYQHDVFLKFDNLVAKLKFYNQALCFLNLLIQYGTCKAIIIMLEILESLRFKRSAGDIGFLFYIHGYREQAYEYLKKSLEMGETFPETAIMSEICNSIGKKEEGKKWLDKTDILDFYKEINVHCRKFDLFVEY
ncbi:MAG: glycosyltransferase [Halanaerobiales bacterium]